MGVSTFWGAFMAAPKKKNRGGKPCTRKAPNRVGISF
jgi:hypothetical protein